MGAITKSASDPIWDAYNLLLGGADTERLQKLLVRYELFRLTIDIPGDIVECGVFKGTGLMFWLKLLHLRCHASGKRVIGFDQFDRFPAGSMAGETATVKAFLKESGFAGTSPAEIRDRIAAAGLSAGRCELVAGDIARTAPRYAVSRPGLRISLLHMDLDLEKPTGAALKALWPRVVPGGVVIFDNYAVPRWTESEAVDRFIRRHSVRLRTLPWAKTPTAYAIKETASCKGR